MITSDIQRAVEHLRQGGIVAAASETYLTLCADVARPSAVENVFALKAREKAKAAAILIPSFDAWAPLVAEIPPLAQRLAKQFWPGPLTISLPASANLNPLLAYRNQVAVRIPGHSPAYDILQAFGSPLTATSANPAGAASPLTPEEVLSYFGSRRELLLFATPAPGGMPSTVVEVVGESFKIMRPGAIPPSVLDEFCAVAAE